MNKIQNPAMTEFLRCSALLKKGDISKIVSIEVFINKIIKSNKKPVGISDSDLVTINKVLQELQDAKNVDALTKTSIKQIKTKFDDYLLNAINFFQLVY